MHRQLLALLTLSIVSASSWAQISMDVNIQGPTSGNCDGSVNITVDGVGEVNGLSQILPIFPVDYTSTSSLVSLTNVCETTSYTGGFDIENDSCVQIQVSNILDPSGINSTMLAAGVDYDITINVQPPTTEFSADGSITLVSNDLSAFEIMYISNSTEPGQAQGAVMLGAQFSTVDTVGFGMQVDGLNAGYYGILFQDDLQSGSVSHTRFGFMLEPSGFIGCQDSILVFPLVTPATDNVLCDGNVEAIGWGTVGPYSYSHSSGASTSIDTSLCDGLYTVTVNDDNGNSTIEPYIIPALGNIVNSVNWPFDQTLDTLFTTASQNCGLDFNLPVDSVFIDEVYLIDSLLCQAVWHFYQGGQVFTMTHTYAYDVMGPHIFSVGVYCEDGRSELGYYFAYDEFELSNAGHVGISEQDLTSNYSVQPNPSRDLFVLKTESSYDMTVSVIDVTGKVIYSKYLKGSDAYEIDLLSAKAGMYFLYVETIEGRTCERLIKY